MVVGQKGEASVLRSGLNEPRKNINSKLISPPPKRKKSFGPIRFHSGMCDIYWLVKISPKRQRREGAGMQGCLYYLDDIFVG